jgi:CRP-like cAMP-binding protein
VSILEPLKLYKIYKNRILSCLPMSDLKRLAPHLVPVILHVNDTLTIAGQGATDAYFLEEGLCSIVVKMKDGSTVEVGVIGKEGVVGAAAALGENQTPNRGFIQIAGSGFRIALKTLREEAAHSSELRECLQRSVQGLLMMTAQTAACNRVHEMHERLARWILTCHDRVESDRIPITHEFLGMMLGVGRPTVTIRGRHSSGGRTDRVFTRPRHHPRSQRTGTCGLRVLSGGAQ